MPFNDIKPPERILNDADHYIAHLIDLINGQELVAGLCHELGCVATLNNMYEAQIRDWVLKVIEGSELCDQGYISLPGEMNSPRIALARHLISLIRKYK